MMRIETTPVPVWVDEATDYATRLLAVLDRHLADECQAQGQSVGNADELLRLTNLSIACGALLAELRRAS